MTTFNKIIYAIISGMIRLLGVYFLFQACKLTVHLLTDDILDALLFGHDFELNLIYYVVINTAVAVYLLLGSPPLLQHFRSSIENDKI